MTIAEDRLYVLDFRPIVYGSGLCGIARIVVAPEPVEYPPSEDRLFPYRRRLSTIRIELAGAIYATPRSSRHKAQA